MRRGLAWRIALSGILTSLMLVLGLIERQFPLPVGIPGIKLGLANSVLLYGVYMLGIRQTVILMILKTLMGWFIYSNMSAMLYSFAGGALSVLAMVLISRINGMSVIGASVGGAVCFNIGQVLMAVILMAGIGPLFFGFSMTDTALLRYSFGRNAATRFSTSL